METIPGGAYQRNGQWVNADGKPLDKDQITQAEALHAAQQEQRDADNLAILDAAARNDPLARSLAHALRPQAPATPPSKHESEGTPTPAESEDSGKPHAGRGRGR